MSNFISLKEIIDISKGKKHDNVFDYPIDGFSRYIQIDDLRNDTNLKYTNDKGVSVTEKDVIIAWDGANAGTIGFNLAGYIGSTLARLRIKDKNINTIFLGWFLKSKFKLLRSQTTGATIPHISRDVLENLKIPKVPFHIQQKIASILAKADAARQKRAETLKLTEQFLQSAFLDMFGQVHESKFPIFSLDKVSNKITDGEHGTVKRLETGRLYLMARNITKSNTFDFSELSYISEADHKKIYNRCKPEANDLLMVCVGATIGKTVIVPPNMEEFSLARSVALIKPNSKKILSSYLFWFFNTDFGKMQIKNSRNESAQAGLYTGKLKEIKLPVPPLALQQKFANLVEKVEKLREKQRQSEAELDQLFQSLMQRAFNGELPAPSLSGVKESKGAERRAGKKAQKSTSL